MLIHREYASGASSRLVIEYGRVVTDNPSRPHGFGLLNPDTMVPYQKNPILSAFFREIDRADELGSGMRKMMLYGKKYGGADPQLIEGDSFRMIISVPEFGENPAATAKIVQRELEPGAESRQVTPQVTGQVIGQVTGQVTGQVEKWVINALSACTEPKKSADIQEITGIKHRETFQRNYLDRLLEEGLIVRTIPDKPQSRMQKYIITEKGKQVLENQGKPPKGAYHVLKHT
jgi:ATP-dependent DNA helicase RecG